MIPARAACGPGPHAIAALPHDRPVVRVASLVDGTALGKGSCHPRRPTGTRSVSCGIHRPPCAGRGGRRKRDGASAGRGVWWPEGPAPGSCAPLQRSGTPIKPEPAFPDTRQPVRTCRTGWRGSRFGRCAGPGQSIRQQREADRHGVAGGLAPGTDRLGGGLPGPRLADRRSDDVGVRSRAALRAAGCVTRVRRRWPMPERGRQRLRTSRSSRGSWRKGAAAHLTGDRGRHVPTPRRPMTMSPSDPRSGARTAGHGRMSWSMMGQHSRSTRDSATAALCARPVRSAARSAVTAGRTGHGRHGGRPRRTSPREQTGAFPGHVGALTRPRDG